MHARRDILLPVEIRWIDCSACFLDAGKLLRGNLRPFVPACLVVGRGGRMEIWRVLRHASVLQRFQFQCRPGFFWGGRGRIKNRSIFLVKLGFTCSMRAVPELRILSSEFPT